ncbi:sigma-70 family RNA polymerase sigma factor [Hyphomicrobium sp. CS1GBMeth3]|uniref:sigma-70 family RNA polymerase sigma factor n=1 Tax=Hyphomicrobium sp. CS1GBMeth3 TaxID=1892845 RepID=UPI000932002A|nr:sigma-70 family RNA polymerase sigma factor [Hyphomicrobium sp. CS1GBMeth3]
MSDLPALEDRLRSLMLASLAGDAAAYRDLLGQLSEHLGRYYRRRLRDDLSPHVDDLVQETLLAVHTRRMTYDPKRAFTAWAYAIARYKLIDLMRRSRRMSHVPIDDVADFIADDSLAAPAADLAAALDTLPERTRGLIRRVKIEGRSVAEVAASTGMSESAVKVAVHRGLKSLLGRFGGKQ